MKTLKSIQLAAIKDFSKQAKGILSQCDGDIALFQERLDALAADTATKHTPNDLRELDSLYESIRGELPANFSGLTPIRNAVFNNLSAMLNTQVVAMVTEAGVKAA